MAAAQPALPWGRPPSPPAKRARTEAPTSWATFPASQPARFGLKAGDRVQVAWTFVAEAEESVEGADPESGSFCTVRPLVHAKPAAGFWRASLCDSRLCAVVRRHAGGCAWGVGRVAGKSSRQAS